MTLDNKTNSMFRKIGFVALSGFLTFSTACTRYERINSSSDLKLLLSSNGRSLIGEYSSGTKLYLKSGNAIEDFKRYFHIKNFQVTKVVKPDGKAYDRSSAYGYSVCEEAYSNFIQDLKNRGIGDDIKETIAEKAKIN